MSDCVSSCAHMPARFRLPSALLSAAADPAGGGAATPGAASMVVALSAVQESEDKCLKCLREKPCPDPAFQGQELHFFRFMCYLCRGCHGHCQRGRADLGFEACSFTLNILMYASLFR